MIKVFKRLIWIFLYFLISVIGTFLGLTIWLIVFLFSGKDLEVKLVTFGLKLLEKIGKIID